MAFFCFAFLSPFHLLLGNYKALFWWKKIGTKIPRTVKLFSKRKYRWEVEQDSYWSFCVNLLMAFFPLSGFWCGNHSFLLNFQCSHAGVDGLPFHPENHVGHITNYSLSLPVPAWLSPLLNHFHPYLNFNTTDLEYECCRIDYGLLWMECNTLDLPTAKPFLPTPIRVWTTHNCRAKKTLSPAQVRCQSCLWPLKLMMSQ